MTTLLKINGVRWARRKKNTLRPQLWDFLMQLAQDFERPGADSIDGVSEPLSVAHICAVTSLPPALVCFLLSKLCEEGVLRLEYVPCGQSGCRRHYVNAALTIGSKRAKRNAG